MYSKDYKKRNHKIYLQLEVLVLIQNTFQTKIKKKLLLLKFGIKDSYLINLISLKCFRKWYLIFSIFRLTWMLCQIVIWSLCSFKKCWINSQNAIYEQS